MRYKKLHTPVEPKQTAVIPYRIRDNQIEVLLITTRKKKRWIVPKGWIEKKLSPHTSARQEAREEAGVTGTVSPHPLGCYRHGSARKGLIVQVFLMRVERELKSWPEKKERQRRWVSLKQARKLIKDKGLRSILEEAVPIMQLDDAYEVGDVLHPALPE